MGSANERRRYNVTSSPIGWAHTQKDLCIMYFIKDAGGWEWWLWGEGSLTSGTHMHIDTQNTTQYSNEHKKADRDTDEMDRYYARWCSGDASADMVLLGIGCVIIVLVCMVKLQCHAKKSCNGYSVWINMSFCSIYISNKANLRDLIAVTGLVISNWIQIVIFSACVTVKFDGWPRKTIGHLFYTTSSFVYHFKSIGEFKLDLQSRNVQFGSKVVIFYPVWPWNLMDDLGKQYGTSYILHQALCIISKPSMTSNLSYSPETLKSEFVIFCPAIQT